MMKKMLEFERKGSRECEFERKKKKLRSTTNDDSKTKEFWDMIAGADSSKDDEEGVRSVDDDNVIDYASAGDTPQVVECEEDDEIELLFKMGNKRKRTEKSAEEIASIVEHHMAEFEVSAEEDAELNRQSKPAINKLKKLPLLTQLLSKPWLQQEFLDHGVLTLLKDWLEPLPDGSLPNTNIRTAILKILADFPIDLHQEGTRELLKKSGLGKVIMFLSRSDEETMANRKEAKNLVETWSRPIFNKSLQFEDMRSIHEKRIPYRRLPMNKPVNKALRLEYRDDDLDLAECSQGPRSNQSSSRQHAFRPKALPMVVVKHPQSKIDPDEVRPIAKQFVQDQHRMKVDVALNNLGKAKKLIKFLELCLDKQEVTTVEIFKKRALQAMKPSVEGQGIVNIF